MLRVGVGSGQRRKRLLSRLCRCSEVNWEVCKVVEVMELTKVSVESVCVGSGKRWKGLWSRLYRCCDESWEVGCGRWHGGGGGEGAPKTLKKCATRDAKTCLGLSHVASLVCAEEETAGRAVYLSMGCCGSG